MLFFNIQCNPFLILTSNGCQGSRASIGPATIHSIENTCLPTGLYPSDIRKDP